MIGTNVAELRKKLKISQRELGRRSGVSGQMISKIENDNTIPSLRTLTKIADVFNVTPNELLEGESDLINVETDDVIDVLNLIYYADGIKLDDIELTKDEKEKLNEEFIDALNLIRYSRLKNDTSNNN